MPKDAYYFKHDSNARNDPKIKALKQKYGIEGYGRYWIIIEILRESTGYKIIDKMYNWQSIALEFKCELPEVMKFMNDCIDEFDSGCVHAFIVLRECKMSSHHSDVRSCFSRSIFVVDGFHAIVCRHFQQRHVLGRSS